MEEKSNIELDENIEILDLDEEIEKWQKLLGLQEWDFSVETLKTSLLSDSGELAKCFISEESMSCNLIFAIEIPVDEIKKSVRHELLHVALNNLRSVFDDVVQLLGAEAQTAFNMRYNKNEEKIVIKLERMLDKISYEEQQTEKESDIICE